MRETERLDWFMNPRTRSKWLMPWRRRGMSRPVLIIDEDEKKPWSVMPPVTPIQWVTILSADSCEGPVRARKDSVDKNILKYGSGLDERVRAYCKEIYEPHSPFEITPWIRFDDDLRELLRKGLL